jgi:Lar family restriction alleviation protein
MKRASIFQKAAGVNINSMSTDARKVENMSKHALKPCPFCGSEPMLGEVRPAMRKSPPLFGITCIHCGAEMSDEFVPELIQRWNARAVATASIDKEVMKGAFDKERRDVAERLWKHIGKPLFTGQDIEDIIGVRRSDFNLILADASYRRLADLIEPEPELPLNVYPFCGTGVMGEGRDAVHG